MGNKEISFIESDTIGFETLDVFSTANRFNGWMYNTIKPYLKGNILEIGSGIGNITQFILNDGFYVTASDIRDHYCSIINKRFDNQKHLSSVRKIDIVHPDFDAEYKNLFNSFDSLVALNIIEHVQDDKLAIQNCRKLLRNDGHLIILMPAYKWLYNELDENLGHYKRYNRARIKKLVESGKFEIQKTRYFNFTGMFGWWLSGSLLRKKTIVEGQMTLYNKMVPLFKVIDNLVLNRAGLSVIAIGKKCS